VSRVLKIALVAVAVYILWQKVLSPWMHKPVDITGTSAAQSQAVAMGASSCPELAAKASETWGGGLARFANPPYDTNEWSEFHDKVTTAVGLAEATCTCGSESCLKAREAVSNLRSLLNAFDTAVRNGSAPPDDAVQQQEKIDQAIEQARQLVREGK
jgi:hypothetical protein